MSIESHGQDRDSREHPAVAAYYSKLPQAMGRKYRNVGPGAVLTCPGCAGRHGCPYCIDDGFVQVSVRDDGSEEFAPCPHCMKGHMNEFDVAVDIEVDRKGRHKVDARGTPVFFVRFGRKPRWGTAGYWQGRDLSWLEKACPGEPVSFDEVCASLAEWARLRGYENGFAIVWSAMRKGVDPGRLLRDMDEAAGR